ncbi:MAG TPA: hypothetical protein VMA37_06820 [Acetobacteraceae bacterium]|nr:hypothetical protein [Acetobacteraceae bacterium]
MNDDARSGPMWPGAGMGLDAFLAIVRDAWAFGSKDGDSRASSRDFFGEGRGGEGKAADPFASMLEPFRTFRASAASGTPWGGAGAAEFLGQAGLIAMMSGFRYWQRLAALWSEHLELLSRVGSGGAASAPEAQRLLLTEGLRRLGRELGEVASQEARRFQAELDRLAFELAASADDPRSSTPRRYVRVKP